MRKRVWFSTKSSPSLRCSTYVMELASAMAGTARSAGCDSSSGVSSSNQGFPGIAGGAQRVLPIEDGDPHRLFFGRRAFHASLHRQNPLRAQLIDLFEQLFNTGPHLFALGLQRGKFVRQPSGFSLSLGGLGKRRIFFLTQAAHQLNRLLDAILQAEQPIRLVGGRHFFSSAARAVSLTSSAVLATETSCWNAASSCSATSASTLRFSSRRAAFRPFRNLLYEMPASRQAALMRTIHSERYSRFLFLRPT